MDARTQHYFIHNIQVHSSTYSLTLHSTTVYCAILVRLCVNQERTHSMDTIIAQQAIETVNYTKLGSRFQRTLGKPELPEEILSLVSSIARTIRRIDFPKCRPLTNVSRATYVILNKYLTHVSIKLSAAIVLWTISTSMPW